jgi:hypothetical protein
MLHLQNTRLKLGKTGNRFPPDSDGVKKVGKSHESPKKTPAQGGRKVIEAGFIQARNLSSSGLVISNCAPASKLKV